MVVWNSTEYEKKQLPLGLPTEDDVLAMDSIVSGCLATATAMYVL